VTGLTFVSRAEVERIQGGIDDRYARARVVADASRLNVLSMIRYAGSGHVGSSLSAMDLATWIWTEELHDVMPVAAGPGDRYFSSKGHDAPGLYALLIGLGLLDESYLLKLRRIDGLPGHPDVGIPYAVTNTGSLGMGVSKARGLIRANRLNDETGRVFVMVGDGELQEGQFWESLQPSATEGFSEITVVVDHNKFQSDARVSEVSHLGEIEAKVAAFGWAVARCDGHDFRSIEAGLTELASAGPKPRLLLADTIKGRGVSFMQGDAVPAGGLYRYHSGAPAPEIYVSAVEELIGSVNDQLKAFDLAPLATHEVEGPTVAPLRGPDRLVSAYADELRSIGDDHDNVVVLDADLMVDCGTQPFKERFPSRFIEAGIAEQDMVSQAGTLALKGKIPIVHSFACFLSTRANEQIYNNATERSKIVYHASLAGLLPAGPGHSHQSVRDISAVGSIPDLVLIQPANERETRMALRWAVEENPGSTWVRLSSVAIDLPYRIPPSYELQLGRGVSVRRGADGVIVAYGPVMLTEAIRAAEILEGRGRSYEVVNLPWLNRLDRSWFADLVRGHRAIAVIEDHYTELGQASFVARAIAEEGLQVAVRVLGVEGVPKCGQNQEVLEFHGLSGSRIADRLSSDR
jgi:transketolase